MANAMYGKGRQAFLEGGIAWLSDNIKTSLVTSSYSVSINSDQYYGVAISGGNVVAASGNLASKTSTLGTADAADITFSAVSGSTASIIVVWKDTGTSTTSPLILYIDVATNLPVTPNGGDITVQWDNGSNKIFTLFEGLGERDRLNLWDWLKSVFGWGGKAELAKEGIWIPAPRIVQSAPPRGYKEHAGSGLLIPEGAY